MVKSPLPSRENQTVWEAALLSISKIPTFSLYLSIYPNAVSAAISVSGRTVTRKGSKEERGRAVGFDP